MTASFFVRSFRLRSFRLRSMSKIERSLSGAEMSVLFFYINIIGNKKNVFVYDKYDFFISALRL